MTIVKGIRDINDRLRAVAEAHGTYATAPGQERAFTEMAKGQVEKLVGQMEAEMRQAARDLEFERAAALRDEIQEIRLRVLDEDESAAVARAAETSGEGSAGRDRQEPTAGAGAVRSDHQAGPARRGSTPGGGAGERRRRRAGGAATLEVTEVRVLPAGEEPGGGRARRRPPTASDWLPGIRDEHEDDGWAVKWLDRPTWDHTVTPNVIKRTGPAPGRPAQAPALRAPGSEEDRWTAERGVPAPHLGHGEADPAPARVCPTAALTATAPGVYGEVLATLSHLLAADGRYLGYLEGDAATSRRRARIRRAALDELADQAARPGRPLAGRAGSASASWTSRSRPAATAPSCRTPRTCSSARRSTTATTIAPRSAPCCRSNGFETPDLDVWAYWRERRLAPSK